jgi:hypothetical protein
MRPIDIWLTAMGSFMLQSVVFSGGGKRWSYCWFLCCIVEAYLGVQSHELVAAMSMLQEMVGCSYCYWHFQAFKSLWTLFVLLGKVRGYIQFNLQFIT